MSEKIKKWIMSKFGGTRTIRIETVGDSRMGKNYRLYIDNADVSNMVRGFDLSVSGNKRVTITVDFVPQRMELPEELRALVETHGYG